MNRNRNRNRPQPIGPIHRAVAYKQWTEQGVDAQIHALMGGDPKQMCNLAGRMFFTILGAAMTEKLSAEEPDLRIVRGAVNAVYDQVDAEQVSESLRASIASGLEATKRIAARVSQRAIVDSHFSMLDKLRRSDVLMSDFEGIVERIAA